MTGNPFALILGPQGTRRVGAAVAGPSRLSKLVSPTLAAPEVAVCPQEAGTAPPSRHPEERRLSGQQPRVRAPCWPPNISSLCDGPSDLPQLPFRLALGVKGALFVPVADRCLFTRVVYF